MGFEQHVAKNVTLYGRSFVDDLVDKITELEQQVVFACLQQSVAFDGKETCLIEGGQVKRCGTIWSR